MAIKKQEFYEGAALHVLAQGGHLRSVVYEPPFFVFNETISVLLKHSARARSPWAFTFTPDEQSKLRLRSQEFSTKIGLICGSDGIAALSYSTYQAIAALRQSALHLACYRDHGQQYDVRGPDGSAPYKVPTSSWHYMLHERSL